MKYLNKPIYLIVFALLISAVPAMAQELRYDADENGVILYGPFVKYNFLKPPYSFGLSAFKKSDISLKMNRTGKDMVLQARWPSYFMEVGEITIYDSKSRRIKRRSMAKAKISVSGKQSSFKVKIDKDTFLAEARKGIHFCVKSVKKGGYEVEVCSDKMSIDGGALAPMRKSKKVLVLTNGVKVPTNAQVAIPPEQKDLDLYVKFRSGCKIRIEEPVYRITKDQLAIDSQESLIFIQHKQLTRRESSASFGKVLKTAFQEKNYIADEDAKLKSYSREINDEDMEFAPFEEGRSLQLFIVSFPELPEKIPPVKVLEEKTMGTYSSSVKLKVSQRKNLKVETSDGKRLKSKSRKGLLTWSFRAPRKGEFNKDSLKVSDPKGNAEDKPKSYSAQVYRGHSGSIAARAAISSGLVSVVPGFQLQADYWPETILNDKSPFFQRWGIGVGHSKALSDFKIAKFGGNLQQSSMFADLMYRFTPGVRPQKRSWGAGLRYFNLGILGGERGDIDAKLMGVGLFWHTAPLGLIDAAVSAVPFFRHPKWMEISAYYYPVSITENFSLGAAFSLHARGRMMFARKWFLDASINYHFLNFRKKLFGGSASVVEGSLGLGYNF